MPKLPPVPEPVSLGICYFDEHIFGYTKEQLLEYGQQVRDTAIGEVAADILALSIKVLEME